MKFFVAAALFLLIFIGFFHPVASITQDLGRHLATGNIILQTHSVPKANLFSYTYPNFPFVNHHWLSEVIYAIAFPKIGFDGLLLMNTALILLSLGLVIAVVYKKINVLALAICSLLYIPILFERTDVRPEFFSFLFLSLFIIILYKFREKYTRLIFLLPAIELLWVNTHIYFPIGILIIGFFLIDAIAYLIKNPNTKARIPKQIQIIKTQNSKHFDNLKIRILNIVSNFDIRISSLLFILIASMLATLINPNGLKGALYPLSVFQNYGYQIEENQNIFFLWSLSHKPSILFFFIASPALFISLFLNLKRVLIAEWLISIFFTFFAASAVRNFPLFVLATIIPFLKYFPAIKFSLPKYIKVGFIVLLLGLGLFEVRQIYTRNGFGVGADSGAKAGADFFIQQRLKGPIFNNFDIGSYLDYRLYPQEKVFVDGRPEAYPSAFFRDKYIPMQIDPIIFAKEDQKYNFQTIFFSHTDQTPWAEKFMQEIVQNKNWHMVYLDDFTVILTKDKNINPIIKTDYSNLRSLIQLAHFFQNKNFTNEEIKIYQEILNINPAHCPALYNLALKLQETRNPAFSIFADKFQKNCQ